MSEQKKLLRLKSELAEKREQLNKLEYIHMVNEDCKRLQAERDKKIAEINSKINQENALHSENYNRLMGQK